MIEYMLLSCVIYTLTDPARGRTFHVDPDESMSVYADRLLSAT